MRFAVLGSGSKGNCVVVDGGGVKILIDCGYPPREIRKRMRGLGLELDDVDALCVTHGHGDHIRGARVLAKNLGIPTYATDATGRFMSALGGLSNHEPFDESVP